MISYIHIHIMYINQFYTIILNIPVYTTIYFFSMDECRYYLTYLPCKHIITSHYFLHKTLLLFRWKKMIENYTLMLRWIDTILISPSSSSSTTTTPSSLSSSPPSSLSSSSLHHHHHHHHHYHHISS